jgi:hypothetical protein
MTIPLDRDRPFGTFDFLPAGHGSASAFAMALTSAARDNHGVALPAFVKKLVAARAADEAKLRRFIDTCVSRFKRAVGVDPNDGSAIRVTD